MSTRWSRPHTTPLSKSGQSPTEEPSSHRSETESGTRGERSSASVTPLSAPPLPRLPGEGPHLVPALGPAPREGGGPAAHLPARWAILSVPSSESFRPWPFAHGKSSGHVQLRVVPDSDPPLAAQNIPEAKPPKHTDPLEAPGGLPPLALPACASFPVSVPAGRGAGRADAVEQAALLSGRRAHTELRVSLSVFVLDLRMDRGFVFFFFQCILIHACQCLLRCLQAFGSPVSGTGGSLLTSSLLCFDVFSCLSILLCPRENRLI